VLNQPDLRKQLTETLGWTRLEQSGGAAEISRGEINRWGNVVRSTTSTRIDGAMRIAWGLLSTALLCVRASQDFPSKPSAMPYPVFRPVATSSGWPDRGAEDERGLRPAGHPGRTGPARAPLSPRACRQIRADGTTLLVVSGAFVTQAATMKKLPYDPIRIFHSSRRGTYPLVFSVRSDSRFKTLDEFVGT